MNHTWLRLRWQQADPLLLASTLALIGYGVVLVMSASWHYANQPGLLNNSLLLKQMAFAVVGCVAMGICATLQPRLLWSFAYIFYAGSLIGLIAVLALGHGSADYGAQRWLEVAGLPLQPSEPAKVALVVVLARVLSVAEQPSLRRIAISAGLTL